MDPVERQHFRIEINAAQTSHPHPEFAIRSELAARVPSADRIIYASTKYGAWTDVALLFDHELCQRKRPAPALPDDPAVLIDQIRVRERCDRLRFRFEMLDQGGDRLR